MLGLKQLTNKLYMYRHSPLCLDRTLKTLFLKTLCTIVGWGKMFLLVTFGKWQYCRLDGNKHLSHFDMTHWFYKICYLNGIFGAVFENILFILKKNWGTFLYIFFYLSLVKQNLGFLFRIFLFYFYQNSRLNIHWIHWLRRHSDYILVLF